MFYTAHARGDWSTDRTRPNLGRYVAWLAVLILALGWPAAAQEQDDTEVMRQVVETAALPNVSGMPLALISSPALAESEPVDVMAAFESMLSRVGYLETINAQRYLVHHTDGSSRLYTGGESPLIPTATAKRLEPEQVVAGIEKNAARLQRSLGKDGVPARVPLTVIRRTFILACFLYLDGEDPLARRLFRVCVVLHQAQPREILNALLPDIAEARYRSGLDRALQRRGGDWNVYEAACKHVLQHYPEAFPYTEELRAFLPNVERMTSRYIPGGSDLSGETLLSPIGLYPRQNVTLPSLARRMNNPTLLPMLAPTQPGAMPRPYTMGDQARDAIRASLPRPPDTDEELVKAAETFHQRHHQKTPAELAMLYTMLGTADQQLAAAQVLVSQDAAVYATDIESVLLTVKLPSDRVDPVVERYLKKRGDTAADFLEKYMTDWPRRLETDGDPTEPATDPRRQREAFARIMNNWTPEQLISRVLDDPALMPLYADDIPGWYRRHLNVLATLQLLKNAETPARRRDILRLLSYALTPEHRAIAASTLQYRGDFRATLIDLLSDQRLVAAEHPRPIWEVLTERFTTAMDSWRPDPYVLAHRPAMQELRDRIIERMNGVPPDQLTPIPSRSSLPRIEVEALRDQCLGMSADEMAEWVSELPVEDRLGLAELERQEARVSGRLATLRTRISQVNVDPTLAITPEDQARAKAWLALAGESFSPALFTELREQVTAQNIRVTWSCYGGAIGSRLTFSPLPVANGIPYIHATICELRIDAISDTQPAIWPGASVEAPPADLPVPPGFDPAKSNWDEPRQLLDGVIEMVLPTATLLKAGDTIVISGYRR